MKDLVSYDGTVHKVIFQNEENGFAILSIVTDEDEAIIAAGCVPCAAPGESLSITGTWKEHPQFGMRLQIKDVERFLPDDPEQIYLYLSSNACPCIGAALAGKIVEHFNDNALEVLESSPERLAEIPGVSPAKAAEIGSFFQNHLGLRRLMAFLTRYHLPPVLAMQLRQTYGDQALSLLKEDPYYLTGCGVEFRVLDHIALDLGVSPGSERRIQAGVLYELQFNADLGQAFIPRPKLIDATAKFLECSADQAETALDQLIQAGNVIQEPIGNALACYHRRLWEAETSIVQRLGLLLDAQADQGPDPDQIADELAQEFGITYAGQQRRALELAGRVNVMALTGGPGTGKTTTVRGILRVFQRMGLQTVLAAPTGRAAMRLSEATGMEAHTIHRLLGTHWNGTSREVVFTKNEKEPLSANAVVVDEMSMVELSLFDSLLRALKPGTRLVMVGDPDQLPPVGPGNVFSDLLRSGRVETVRLTEIFRQAEKSAIIRNARAVNQGQPPRLVNDQPDFFFFRRRSADRATSLILDLCQTRLPQNMHIPPDQIQVLSVTRKGDCGTVRLNSLLQEALNPPSPKKAQLQWGESLFRVGDRIMQTHNDYNIIWQRPDGTAGSGIFNGDIGKILSIDPASQRMELDFDGRRAIYAPEQFGELELAYALTVHKSQGGEFRAVILAALPAAKSLMVRRVLYTAITRAKELMIVVGDDEVVCRMAESQHLQKRYTGLYWKLVRDASS